MSSETQSVSEQNTPRYFYARERSPLWSSYRTYASLKSDIARRNDISHLATPTCFTESRLRRAKDPEVVTNDIYENVRHKLKCLNCGLKGHTILKCDKISRFSDLNCREPNTGSFSDTEDTPTGFFRRSFSTRKSTDRYSTGSFNIQKEVNSDANYPKLPKCRLCGLKGHMSLNCHRDGSPNHKKLSVPFPSHLSFIESPYFVKRRFGNGNSFDSPNSEINGAYLQNGYHNHQNDSNSNTLPKTTFLTPLRARQDLETIPDTESPSSKSLPIRLKSPRTKRVRIDPNNSDLSTGDASVRRRPTLTGAETDNDSGLGFCSSSDVEASPMDMFEILESSIRQYEKEFDEKLRFDVDESDILEETSDQCFEGSSVNGDINGSNEKPNKKLHKLRLKLIKSWFKKSVQK